MPGAPFCNCATLSASDIRRIKSFARALKVCDGSRQIIGSVISGTRLAVAEKAQQAYLQQIAVAELSDQKGRLDAYESQARFALATMYDKAATGEPPKPGPATPQPAAPDAIAPVPRLPPPGAPQ